MHAAAAGQREVVSDIKKFSTSPRSLPDMLWCAGGLPSFAGVNIWARYGDISQFLAATCALEWGLNHCGAGCGHRRETRGGRQRSHRVLGRGLGGPHQAGDAATWPWANAATSS